ncbi:MAPEG family protein [Flexibacterium corallicola]|uniref:MAPEG family protein n=1 Tax=Flexibacterium corallicola TaxID=3037259 RepID=UPI00286F3752|nr:MAPEG family protein [Pseudovibrio sp. M1P-2-3]
MTGDDRRKQKISIVILAYPFALLFTAAGLNWFVFGVERAVVSIPVPPVVAVLVMSAVLLLANHSWLMTSTELVRLRHNIKATPEEWQASDFRREDVLDEGKDELERQHNAHRNATENTVYFVFLALLMGMVSPVVVAAQIWIIGFAVGRLGHTFSYLSGNDSARGLSMSISLLSLYGLASYLALALVV